MTVLDRIKGIKVKEISKEFYPALEYGTHYIEFIADRMPLLHIVSLQFKHHQEKSEIRAEHIVKFYAPTIKLVAKEFNISPIVIAAVIYQEQATNVNFVDYLTDYIGGVMHINTSVGIGQVRVETAKALEKVYPQLKSKEEYHINYDAIVTARLSDPFTNIRYVAAKIKFSADRWKDDGFDISNMSDILGTLYNLEDVNNPLPPRPNPEANSFGLGVQENYEKIRKLME
jgi:hypothetical protein